MEIQYFSDYRNYLRSVLENRVGENSQYSMRAFARDLKMTPQMLSFVLNKKKNISSEVAAKIAERLSLSPTDTDHFLDLVMLMHTKSGVIKKIIEARIQERQSNSDQKFQNLDVEIFKVVGDWLHYAILELTQVRNFQSNPTWISKRLGVTIFEVEQALQRLLQLELLEIDAHGKINRTNIHLTANYACPNAALRRLAKQFLERAIESLEEQEQDERDITNITMAIDPKLLPQAKLMIADFRRKLCKYLEQGQRTEVYTFAPSLFRISKLKQENTK